MKPDRTKYGYVPSDGTCRECGKVRWPTKGDAKLAARRAHPGDRLSFYRCGDAWHYGHLPARVRAGMVSRGQVYGEDA